MRVLSVIAFAIALYLVSGPQVLADDLEVSGHYRVRNGTVIISAPGLGITGIESRKRDSSPCRLNLIEQPLSDGGSSLRGPSLNNCATKISRLDGDAKFEDPNVFVRGLSICHNRKMRHLNPVMIGLKLYGASVVDGTVTPLEAGREVGFQKKLCHEWQEAIFCADGEIATGVTAYLRKARVDDLQIVGLSLICSSPS